MDGNLLRICSDEIQDYRMLNGFSLTRKANAGL
jgi:hypothetical protein